MKFSLQLGRFNLGVERTPAPAGEAKSLSDFARAWLRGSESELGGGAALVSAYQQSVWVYACVTTLAENVSGIPFRIVTGEGETENVVAGGPAVELFNKPHPLLDRFSFWELGVDWLALRGELFLIALDQANGVIDLSRPLGGTRIAKLHYLQPDAMRGTVEANELLGWRYTASSQEAMRSLDLLPGEVIHIKLPNPYNFWRGMSPLQVAQLAAATDYAAAQFMKGLMLNNADTGLIVGTDQQPSAEQREAILAALRERKRKAGTADRPLFLWGGAKVEKPQMSIVDLQFLENRKFSRQEICAVYKVPQEILGYTEDANRSVADAARLSFMENRIAPLCKKIEAGAEPIVTALQADARGEFHVKGTPIMQAAQRARFDSAVKAFGIGVPLNTANKVFDLGLPKLAHGDRAYLPYSLQEVGAEAAAAAGEQVGEGAGEKPAAPQQDAFARLEKLLNPQAASRKPQCATCGGARSDDYGAAIAGAVRVKKSKLARFFWEQRGRVMSKLDELQKMFNAQRSTLNVQQAALADIFDLVAENKLLLQRVRPLLRGDLEFGAAQLGTEIGVEDFKIPPKEALKWIERREKKIASINETTWSELKDTLHEGLSKGDTMEQMIERVKDVYQAASDLRAESIAITETNTAVNSGRFMAMTDAGVELKAWGTSNLENVRASHLRAEAESAGGIPLGERFANGLMYPGDPAGPPEEVINCRCHAFAVTSSKFPVPGYTRALTFEQWREKHPEPEVGPANDL